MESILEWGQAAAGLIGWGVAAVATAIAIKGSVHVNLDINEYLKRRDHRARQRMRNTCTHTRLLVVEEKLTARSFFESPSGTLQWICSRCGMRTSSESRVNEIAEYWLLHPKEWSRREKEFAKVAKKL